MSDPREPHDSDGPPDPWWRADDATTGLGFARFFAWSGFAIAAAALVIAVFAPLEGQALRTVWLTGFAVAGMWVAFMAVSRYRALGIRRSPVVTAAMVAGTLTIAIAIYAFAAIALRSGGIELPAPEHWVSSDHGGPAPGITAERAS